MRNLAVIDIGSNSVRLLLRADGAEKQMLETTRLGQGVAERMLQPEPVRRTVEAIGMFCRLARETGAEQVFAFATSAVRDAHNPEALLDPVWEKYGVKIDILPGEVEAQLAYLGAAGGKRACVVDIGGASTELVAGDREVQRAVSLQIGAVRLKDRFGLDRKTAEKELDALFTDQRSVFEIWQDAPFLGIGGTVTTLAAMEQRMAVYDPQRINGFDLTRERVSAWVDELWPLPAERRVYPGLQPQRADIIAHGALILERCLTVLDRPKVCVCTGDNLKGYLAYKGVE